MKIWIHVGDEQRGPYTLDEVKSLGITPDTPVWYAGLTQWMRASEAPVTAMLFGPVAQSSDNGEEQVAADEDVDEIVEQMESLANNEDSVAESEETVVEESAHSHDFQEQPRMEQPYGNMYQRGQQQGVYPQQSWPYSQGAMYRPAAEKKPSSFLWLSILLTVLCCNPLAILGIVFAIKVDSRWSAGDVEGAKRFSEYAQWCIAITIVLMLMLMPLYMVVVM